MTTFSYSSEMLTPQVSSGKGSPRPPDIVIVDDTPDNLRLLFRVLTERGYRVRPVLSGERALVAVQQEPPDLVLLDIMMPDLDGYAICMALKASAQTRDIPVIFLSALNDVVDKVRAFGVGGVDFITKPFQPEEVLARVTTHLALQQARQQLQQQHEHLAQVNAQLEDTIRDLERHNLELDLLDQLSIQLQRAESPTGALEASLPYLQRLFEAYPGAVYLLSPDGQQIEQEIGWGVPPPDAHMIPVAACPAIPGTPAARRQLPEIGERCISCADFGPPTSLCMTLRSQDEALGVMRLNEVSGVSEQVRMHVRRLLMMVGDHLSLALANLRLRARLHAQAIRDPLTGLFNRRYLTETLERELRRAERRGDPVGFLLLDIDHFKRYNDTYGHHGGDAILRAVAAAIQQHIRQEDMACRFGGEEFLLILPGAALADCHQRAEALCGLVREVRATRDGVALGLVTVSVGVASFPSHGTTAEAVIAAADAALYQAKAAGRDRAVVAE